MILGSSKRGGFAFLDSFFSCFLMVYFGIDGSLLAAFSATWGGLNPIRWLETTAASDA